MADKKSTKSILRALVSNKEFSASEIASATKLSRVIVSKELQTLCDMGITVKSDSRKYKISPDIAITILKIFSDRSESVSFTFDTLSPTRQEFPFLYSLSYDGNVTFTANMAQRYSNIPKNLLSKTFFCIIYDTPINFERAISERFTLKESRAELISEALSSADKTSLYINVSEPLSLLYNSGKLLGAQSYLSTDNISSALKSTFSIFKPDEVIVEGVKNDSIQKICAKNRIPYVELKQRNSLSTDEIEIIVKILCDLAKNK